MRIHRLGVVRGLPTSDLAMNAKHKEDALWAFVWTKRSSLIRNWKTYGINGFLSSVTDDLHQLRRPRLCSFG